MLGMNMRDAIDCDQPVLKLSAYPAPSRLGDGWQKGALQHSVPSPSPIPCRALKPSLIRWGMPTPTLGCGAYTCASPRAGTRSFDLVAAY